MLLERWQRYWSWLFYGLLLVATGVAVADVGSDRRRGAIVVLAVALGVWYRQARAGRLAYGGRSRALGGWAVGGALWASLLVLQGVFALLMFSAYHLACATPLPVRRALPGIVAVSAILVATQSVRRGGVDPLQLLFFGAVTLALGLFIAFTQAIHEQSEERRRLISSSRPRAASWPSQSAGRGHSPSASVWRARSTTRWRKASRASSRSTRRRRRSLPRAPRSRWGGSRRSAEQRARACLRRGASSGRFVPRHSQRARSQAPSTGSSAISAPRPASTPRAVSVAIHAPSRPSPRRPCSGLRRRRSPMLAGMLERAGWRSRSATWTMHSCSTCATTALASSLADRERDGWQAGGFGLTSMRERLEGLGGSLTIESEPGVGTTVAAAVPDVPTGRANDEPHPSAESGVR